MDKPTIGHYASHQRDVTAQEDSALNAALRSSTVKVEHPEIARLRAELAEYRRDAERYRRLCSLVAWGELGVCRGHNDTDEFADDGDMLDAWLDSPEMIAEAQGIDAALAALEGGE